MRGHVDGQQAMFVAFNIEGKTPQGHPLRAIKSRCDAILKDMSRDFNACSGHTGRFGSPPEAITMNRERFEKHDLVNKFFQRVVREGIADKHDDGKMMAIGD